MRLFISNKLTYEFLRMNKKRSSAVSRFLLQANLSPLRLTMSRYQHRRHNKNKLMIHLILVTKYRKTLLSGNIRTDIMQYIYNTCQKSHWYIKRMETDRVHLHMLLQYNPTDSVTKIVAHLKQGSTWEIWKSHGELLRKHFWKERTFWSDGYFAASVGEVSQDTIEHYIETQG